LSSLRNTILAEEIWQCWLKNLSAVNKKNPADAICCIRPGVPEQKYMSSLGHLIKIVCCNNLFPTADLILEVLIVANAEEGAGDVYHIVVA
jgi:hypothetical protein